MPSESEELQSIRNTLAAYNVAGDRLRLEDLAATFLPDGVLEMPGATLQGREAIMRGLGGADRESTPGARSAAKPSFVRHHLTTSHIEMKDETTAGARSYFIVFTDIGLDHVGAYADTLHKVEGQWLFRHRRVMIDWMHENTFFSSQLEIHRARISR
jgi:hypothetical protein